MKPDNINLILLCLPPVVACLFVWRLHPTREDLVNNWLGQFLLGLVGTLFFIMLILISGRHKCMAGQPDTHIAIGVISATVVMFGTCYGKKRILSGILILILIEVPIQHYHHLVHGGAYVGTPQVHSMHVDDRNKLPVYANPLWHTPVTRLYKLPYKATETTHRV
jgi:hypothetical protein